MDEIRTQHVKAAVDERPRPAQGTDGPGTALGADGPGRSAPEPAVRGRASWVDWLTTTDHKKIGTLYLVSAFVFFVVGGVMALMMRAELARPGL